MHKRHYKKPDGRSITLYAREEVERVGPIMTPRAQPVNANPHMRWHPLRGEWVVYAAHRQDRTFLPPPEYNPLLPSDNADVPTELPVGRYDIAVFDNLFPSLAQTAHDPPDLSVPTAPAIGKCEVVVFTQDPRTSLGALPVTHLDLLLEVWGDRTCELMSDERIKYVLPFENRGVEVGVTLHHPHGQLYAYSVVPPVAERLRDTQVAHHVAHRRSLLEELIAKELRVKQRLVYDGEHAVAFVPAWARYPYEVWIAPKAPVAFFHDLSGAERRDCSRALKTVLMKFDALWERPFPYIMAWYQALLDGQPHPEWHLHAELYPPYRTRDKLKYLAGTEIAAGLFASDVLPETAAAALQAVQVECD